MPHDRSASDGRSNHVAPLTSVRFLAAVYVVLFHTAPAQIRAMPLAARFVSGGYIGVSFFFVLSGFVLGWNYLERFAAGEIRRADFWRARVARVYPVYLVGLAAAAPFVVYGTLRKEPTLTAAAAYLGRSAALAVTLTQSWMPTYATVWNFPSWSLSVEAFFYALFPVLVIGAIALPKRRVGAAIVVAWLAAMLAPAIYLLVHPDGPLQPTFVADGFWLDALRYGPVPHLFQFLIGLLGARWLLDRRSRNALVSSGDATWRLLALVAVALTILMVGQSPLYPFLHNGLLAPLFLAIIVLLVTGEGTLVRLLSCRGFVVLGEASYALYLLHVPVAGWLNAAGKRVGLVLDPASGIAAFATYVLVAIAVSVFTWRHIEEPARRAIRHGRLPRLSWRGAFDAARRAATPEG